VLIVPAGQSRRVTIEPGFDLAAILGADGRLATGDPAHVPVGIYARQALEKLGLWDSLRPRLAPANDVRNAMLLVERGEAPAGIVYATDAAVSRKVMIADSFPENTHQRISYPFSVVRSGDTPEARALMEFLGSRDVLALFAARGFAVE